MLHSWAFLSIGVEISHSSFIYFFLFFFPHFLHLSLGFLTMILSLLAAHSSCVDAKCLQVGSEEFRSVDGHSDSMGRF